MQIQEALQKPWNPEAMRRYIQNAEKKKTVNQEFYIQQSIL